MNGSLSDSHTLSTRVIDAVADAEGIDPCDLSEPLADVLDPDALDALFRDRPDTDGQVRFRFCGYIVTAMSNGNVEVEQPTDIC